MISGKKLAANAGVVASLYQSFGGKNQND